MNFCPTISVIIPCFNNEETIIETIESITKQEYSSYEIIIVNDGSTDKSADIVSNFIKINNSNNITLINQINSGPSKSRNNGADKATGKYLLFLDADDLIAPSYIKKCIDYLEQNQNINIVYSNAAFIGARKGNWNLPEFKLPNYLVENCIFISAVIRKEVFDKVGKFDENLHFLEDWELWIKIIMEFGGVHRISETLFYYRKRFDKSSITDNENIELIKDSSRLYIYNKHYKYYSKNGYDIVTLTSTKEQSERYKLKYYNVWYRKLFYKFKK